MRLVTTLSALALLILPACTSEAAGPAGIYAVSIEFDTTGMPAEQAQMMAQMTGDMAPGDLHLNADGTWDMSTEMEMMGQKQTSTVKGTWVLEGDEIVMTATEQDGEAMDPDVRRSKYADGAFSMDMSEAGGPSMKMTMTKK